MGRDKHRHLGATGRKAKLRKAKRKSKTKALPAPNVQHHPKYGTIPLIEQRFTLSNGDQRSYFVWDPTFKPTMPPGAVRGSIREQRYCCDSPHYYFVDIERRCVTCAKDFVFSGGEQKFWYEKLKFPLYSSAIRCLDCRRRVREIKAVHVRLGATLRALEIDPKSLSALLELAEATLRLRTLAGTGNLNRALAAGRKALRLSPNNAQAASLVLRCKAA